MATGASGGAVKFLEKKLGLNRKLRTIKVWGRKEVSGEETALTRNTGPKDNQDLRDQK